MTMIQFKLVAWENDSEVIVAPLLCREDVIEEFFFAGSGRNLEDYNEYEFDDRCHIRFKVRVD